MKKILFAVLCLLAVGFKSYSQTIIIWPDTTVGTVVATEYVDTLEDTIIYSGFYELEAVPADGWVLLGWDVIVWGHDLEEPDKKWCDTTGHLNIEYVGDTFIDHHNVLDWDMGMPDLTDPTIEGVEDIDDILIIAYFVQAARLMKLNY